MALTRQPGGRSPFTLPFRARRSRRDLINRLHARIADASRVEALYARLGVPDTLEGRFESLGLHVLLVLRRLRGLPDPAGDVGQDLIDAVFRHLDANLRELGVGDTVVPKRIKKLAAAFYVTIERYDPLIAPETQPGLERALAEGFAIDGEPASGLAAYVLGAEDELAGQDLDRLLGDGPLLTPPEMVTGGDR